MARADRVDPEARLDRFAELLSRGLLIPEIAERMGIGTMLAYNLLGQIRRRLGPQAR